MRGQTVRAREMLEEGYEPDIFDAVAVAAHRDLARILEHDPSRVHALSHAGWSALYTAVTASDRKSVEMLLDAGANPDQATDDARLETPLHSAVRNDDAGMVRMLIERGADAKAIDADGRDPSQIAAEIGSWHAAAELAKEETLRGCTSV